MRLIARALEADPEAPEDSYTVNFWINFLGASTGSSFQVYVGNAQPAREGNLVIFATILVVTPEEFLAMDDDMPWEVVKELPDNRIMIRQYGPMHFETWNEYYRVDP